jgi:aspartyl-tRNA(Asn)/glutamyl-tRNA(Gln) amidotransferase subunit B
VIGLEIHVQLATRTKIFCRDIVAFGAAPNSNVCPVCLGLPGALPVLNVRAVELGIRAALGLSCTVHPVSVFARKNYFYPDLPKGYQITQFDKPLATAGRLEVKDGDEVAWCGSGASTWKRTRASHCTTAARADGGRSESGGRAPRGNRHGAGHRVSGARALVPDEAEAAARVSRGQRLRHGEGEPAGRCKRFASSGGTARLGTKTELKNMNSFANLERALEVEIARQHDLLAKDGVIMQQTLLWDAARGEIRPMRGKEESHDYRYFPDPDLPPLTLAADEIEAIHGRTARAAAGPRRSVRGPVCAASL